MGGVADDLSTWTIPADRSKNGVAHVVPLAPQALVLVNASRRADLVFPGVAALQWVGQIKARLDKASGVPIGGCTIRRTWRPGFKGSASGLKSPRLSLTTCQGAAPASSAFSAPHMASEKRAALDAWGEHVAAIVEGREAADNVTTFRARGT